MAISGLSIDQLMAKMQLANAEERAEKSERRDAQTEYVDAKREQADLDHEAAGKQVSQGMWSSLGGLVPIVAPIVSFALSATLGKDAANRKHSAALAGVEADGARFEAEDSASAARHHDEQAKRTYEAGMKVTEMASGTIKLA